LLQNISRLPYQGKVVGALSEIGFDKSTSERPIFSDYILLHSGIYCSSVLRCLRSLPFARENYPTYCMYRRGPIVTGGGKGKFQLDCSAYEVSGEMRVLNQRDFCHHHT